MGSDCRCRRLVEPAHHPAGHRRPYAHPDARFAQNRPGPFVARSVSRVVALAVVKQVIGAISRVGGASSIGSQLES